VTAIASPNPNPEKKEFGIATDRLAACERSWAGAGATAASAASLTMNSPAAVVAGSRVAWDVEKLVF
jgi:hypothetical protein